MRHSFFVLLLILAPTLAYANCPGANGVPDYNCDELVQVTVIGDSLVSGLGDTKNRNRGGYVLRAEKRLRGISFANLGIKGATTEDWLKRLEEIFDENLWPQEREVLLRSDVIFIDVGRNDRWKLGAPRNALVRLRRIMSKLRSEITAVEGAAPVIVSAVLMLPNRGSQGPWVKEFNELLKRANSRSFIADLRFDLVSKRLLSSDQIHPTSAGYDALAVVFMNYIRRNLVARFRQLRPDTDRDGISNYFELNRYTTDPTLPDTDGDGYSDYQEIFVLNRNPLDPAA